jgi:hypothetical protein
MTRTSFVRTTRTPPDQHEVGGCRLSELLRYLVRRRFGRDVQLTNHRDARQTLEDGTSASPGTGLSHEAFLPIE